MDISSLLSTLTSSDSLSGLGSAANVSADSARNILTSALPTLLSGAAAQSQNSETSEGFASALLQHASADTSSISSFLGNVDMSDGKKILSHLFGSDSDSTISSIAENSGASAEETSGVLSAAAPLLMSLLGQQTSSEQASGAGIASIMNSLLGGADVSSLLSGIPGNSGGASVLEQVTGAASSASSESGEKAASGILGVLGKLFGK